MLRVKTEYGLFIYLNDRNSENDQVLKELGVIKDDGTTFDNILINKNHIIEQDNNFKIECTEIIVNNDRIILLDNKNSFSFLGLDDICKKMNFLFNDYIVNINGNRFAGKLKSIETNLIQDETGNLISIGQEKEDTSILTSFIYRMKKDNGHIISPLLKRFSKTAFIIKDKKAIIGYAHLPTYFKILKQTLQVDLSNGAKQFNPKANFILILNSIKPTISFSVDESGNMPVIDMEIEGASITRNSFSKDSDPYLLISSRPIDVTGRKIPYFVIRYGKSPVFVSVLLFSSDEYLSKLKGGINLLNFE